MFPSLNTLINFILCEIFYGKTGKGINFIPESMHYGLERVDRSDYNALKNLNTYCKEPWILKDYETGGSSQSYLISKYWGIQ